MLLHINIVLKIYYCFNVQSVRKDLLEKYTKTALKRQTAGTECKQLLMFAIQTPRVAGFSSAIEYWHTDRRVKTNRSNCLLVK